jgi:glycosyltransferase involved in cell wall biosynthesis
MAPVLPKEPLKTKKIFFVVNDLRYFLSHRLHILEAARAAGAEVAIVAPKSEQEPSSFPHRRIFWRLDPRGRNPIAELISVFQLFKMYRDEKPDIVHHFTIKPVLYGSFVAGIARVAAVVNSISGLGAVFGSWLRKRSLRSLVALRFAKMCLWAGHWSFVFQCEEDRSAFEKAGFLSRARQVLILPGTGVVLTEVLSEKDPSPLPLEVVFVGRLLVRKGARIFLDLARACHADKLPLRFSLIGPLVAGNSVDCLTEIEINNWQTAGFGRYLGYQVDLIPLLHTTHILVLPSSYEEGLPRIVLEGAVACLAMITSDIPALRKYFHDRKELLVSKRSDVHEIKILLTELLEKPETRMLLGRSARKVVEQDCFRPEYFEQRTLNLYRLLLSSSSVAER